MITKLRTITTALAVTLAAIAATAAPATASPASPAASVAANAAGAAVAAAPVVKTISEANGWEWVSGAEAASKPIRKQDLYGCPDNYVCLYKWVNYHASGGRWQAHTNDLIGACWNLKNSSYTVGPEAVNNTSGSLIWNFTRTGSLYYLRFTDWEGCNAANGSSSFQAYAYATMVPNLSDTSTEQDAGIGTNWYHRYTSLGVLN